MPAPTTPLAPPRRRRALRVVAAASPPLDADVRASAAAAARRGVVRALPLPLRRPLRPVRRPLDWRGLLRPRSRQRRREAPRAATPRPRVAARADPARSALAVCRVAGVRRRGAGMPRRHHLPAARRARPAQGGVGGRLGGRGRARAAGRGGGRARHRLHREQAEGGGATLRAAALRDGHLQGVGRARRAAARPLARLDGRVRPVGGDRLRRRRRGGGGAADDGGLIARSFESVASSRGFAQ
mmetsp:Transcript_39206/g.129789  ORF Transcript_39206/g.129789 Transcript_39206/m.129789 type:complete len:242 (-) Transcript_39206:140-865(-)